LLEPRSFGAWRKAITLIIIIFDYSEVDAEVSDDGMATTGFSK